jgi:cell division protein FtsW
VLTVRRTDNSIVGRWWWTIDRWSLLAIVLLIGLGGVLALAASPAVADRLGLSSFHFVKRQLVFALVALALLSFASFLSPTGVRRLGILGFAVAVTALAVATFIGAEVNGARRWLEVGGFVLQPSEFIKPVLVVLVATILVTRPQRPKLSTFALTIVPLGVVITLLLMQPDVGTAMLVVTVWLTQLFVAGLPLIWVAAIGVVGAVGAVVAYLTLPHVASRVDRFLDPAVGDSFQIETAREAFLHGGVLGRGPGEGVLKNVLPDAHTDFIFAVAGEEFGLITGLLLLGLFAFVVLRCLSRALQATSPFVMLAATGLVVQFGLQAVINIGVNLDLMPTKGMTLPFISYGGSSLISMALVIGMVLALTRLRVGEGGAIDVETPPGIAADARLDVGRRYSFGGIAP